MFDLSANPGRSGTIAKRRAPRALATSVCVHLAAGTLLFSLRFTPALQPLPDRALRVTLLDPAPLKVPTLEPRKLPLVKMSAPPTRSLPRVFSLPKTAPVAVSAPVLDLPAPVPVASPARPEIAHLEVPRFTTAPPPPLKTDNLDSPAAEIQQPARRLAVQASGFSDAAVSGGTGARASIATGGFGTAGAGAGRVEHATRLINAGFGDAAIEQAHRPIAKANQAAVSTPVEILSKPRPEYSAEARKMQLEGEVLVEVLFTASGEAQALAVVRGLGHGLDESAVAAARAIRYRPAKRDGEPIDTRAVVHIVFQLAF